MKKLLAMVLSVLLLLTMVPLGAVPVLAETATSGTTGDCTWILDGTYLTISGEGAMEDYSDEYFDDAYHTTAPWGWNITSVTIEEGVTTIGYSAFYGCNSLTSVNIPNSVTSIGIYAFHGCSSLTDVYYDGTLAQAMSIIIEDSNDPLTNAAWYCSDVSAVYWGTTGDCTWVLDGTHLTISGNGAMGDGSLLAPCPWGTSITSVTIEEGVTTIGMCAFKHCDFLTEVIIPDRVTSIGKYAFLDCDSLTEVTIPDSVISIGVYAFHTCKSLRSVTIPNSVTSIVDFVFYECTSLTSVTIPNSVTTIGYAAFGHCDSLTSVTIPDGVTFIGESAFVGCDSLTSVAIGDSVTSIGEMAFYNCGSLTEITVSIANPNYSSLDGVLFDKDQTTLIQCPAGKSGAYAIPNSVTTISGRAFEDCTSLTSVTISDSVTTIGDYAFSSCSKLTSVTIPDSVTSIGKNAFEYCSKLISIIIPDSVTSIGRAAFYYCWSLKSVTIPASVIAIEIFAFYTCSGLKDVYYEGDEAQQAAISIGSYNEDLTSAKWHYNLCSHRYDDVCDEDCNKCGAIREIVQGADKIILFGGNSISEDVSGLAFKFDVAVDGIVIGKGYTADYSNATITFRGEEYKLVGMGAIVNNLGRNGLKKGDVNEFSVRDIFANKVFVDGNGKICFAVRVINIPAKHLDTKIIARPYFVYEKDGKQIVVYGEDQVSSYNDIYYG